MKFTRASRLRAIRAVASFWSSVPITPPKKFWPEKVMVPRQISET